MAFSRAGQFVFLVASAAIGLAGCTSSATRILDGASIGNPSLIVPPDALAKAEPAKPGEVQDSEGNIVAGPGVATEILPGINAPQMAEALQNEMKAEPAKTHADWVGKIATDGIDIVNAAGTMCSTTRASLNQSVIVACSDGRMGQLQTGNGKTLASVRFGKTAESVEFR